MDPAGLPDVLRKKIAVEDSGCWIWTAAKDKHGYGRVNWDGKTRFGHRVVFALLAGDPGDELDHLCRVPACVNPLHLEPVTHAENVKRGDGGKHNAARWPIGRLCPHGHAIAGNNLYAHYSQRLKRWNHQCQTCRRESKRRRRAAGARD